MGCTSSKEVPNNNHHYVTERNSIANNSIASNAIAPARTPLEQIVEDFFPSNTDLDDEKGSTQMRRQPLEEQQHVQKEPSSLLSPSSQQQQQQQHHHLNIFVPPLSSTSSPSTTSQTKKVIPTEARPSYVVPIAPPVQQHQHQQQQQQQILKSPPQPPPSPIVVPTKTINSYTIATVHSHNNSSNNNNNSNSNSSGKDFAAIEEYDFTIAPSIARRVVSITPEAVSKASLKKGAALREICLDDHYRRGPKLGFGAFAIVFVGIHRHSRQNYAIKQIDRSKMFWNDRNALEDEIFNLNMVRNGPHIVQLYEVYEERAMCYLVMELLPGGELLDRILQKKTFTEREARDVCLCILRALDYMHERRVSHRDLKPGNLLLQSFESDTDLKLADFGFAKRVVKHNGCRTLCGTPGYLAPEILERWPAYDVKCDMWSVGVILFLLLGGYLPFDDDDEDLVFDNTRNGKYEFIPNFWSHVSAGAKHLVTRLLTINPIKRISASAALQHEWMRGTDKVLEEKGLNIVKLRDSIVKGQKAKEQAPAAGHRVEQLNDEFNTYLKKKRDDSLLSVALGIKPSIVVRPPQPRGDSGMSFWECFEQGEELGEGGFAIVFRATHRRTKENFAVKDITLSKLEVGGESALQDEIDALKLLRGGPYIVRLFDVFEEPDHTYLVMEEMKGGELLQRIVEKEVYTEREARKVCKILFEAVDFMHNKKVAHRDLKPENLLLVEKGDDTSIKIADFGFAKRVTRPNCLKTLCGTAEYVAPEILDLRMEGYDHRADMWSVGVIVYILLGGYAPFEGPVEDLAELIQKGAYEFHDEYWSRISSAAKDLISSMLQVNPDSRMSAEEALRSGWMIIEEEMLTNKDLSVAQSAIKSLLPSEKLQGMVKAIIATNKLRSLTKEFMGGLGQEDEVSERFSRRTSQITIGTLSTIEHGANSSNNVPFDILYEWGDQLGSGQFSVVHEAKNRQTGVPFAIKRVPRKDLHPSDAVALQDEIIALRAVKDCPQIVHLFDVFEEPDYTYLVLEKMEGGDLIDRIIDRRHYTEKDAKQVATKLLQGVEFCHRRRIANRNLKPENIRLVTSGDDTNVKLRDFGYAKRVLFPNSLRTQCGTEGYVAPEILEHRPAYDVKCDMWSLGVVLYIVLGGYRPFRGAPEDVMRQIRYGEYEFYKKYWSHVSDEAKDLISRMLMVDPMERISASDALKCPWVSADDDTLDKNNLGINLEELKTFKPQAVLRGAVKMIIATNKLQSLGEGCQAFDDF